MSFTDDQIKSSIVSSLTATPKQVINNLFYKALPTATQADFGQYFGVLFKMIQSGQVIAERFYDLKQFGLQEEVSRTDHLTDYNYTLWMNCWHVFYPQMWADRNNIQLRLK